MRPNRPLLLAVAVTVLGLSAELAAAPASAAKSKSKHSTPKPTPLPPGWAVDRVRIEPVDVGGELDVAGVGTYRGAIEIGRQPVSKPLVVTTTTVKPSRSSRRPTRPTTAK